MRIALYNYIIIILFCSCNSSHKKVIEKNEDGSIFEKWVDGSGKEDGVAFLYFPNSVSIKRMMFFDAGSVKGPVLEYYKNGNTKYLFNFENGTINGNFYRFYENNKIKEITIYKSDTIIQKRIYDSQGFLIEVYEKNEIIPKSRFVNIADTFKALLNFNLPNNYSRFDCESMEFNLTSLEGIKTKTRNTIGFIVDTSTNKMLLMLIPEDKGINSFSGKLIFYDTLTRIKFIHKFSGSVLCK